MSKVLSIRLVVKDDGSVALERAAKATDRLGDEAAETSRQMHGLGGSMESSLGILKTLIGAYGGVQLVRGAAALVKMGVDYNSTMEQSKLGIAAIIAGVGQIRDEHGQLVEGAEKFALSQQFAVEMQRQLKLEALKTTASYSDLVRVMQEGLGPALQAGISDQKEIVQLVARIAQAGGALGIQGDRLGQEIRALLQGERGPDNQIANFVFAGMDNAKAKMEALRTSGEVFDFLMERLGSFGEAGEQMGNTVSGAVSNLKDAIEQALGEATQGPTSRLTKLVHELTAEIVTFDKEGNAAFNAEFVGQVEAVANAFVSVASGVGKLAAELPDVVAYVRQLAAPNMIGVLAGISGGVLGGALAGPGGAVLGAGAAYTTFNSKASADEAIKAAIEAEVQARMRARSEMLAVGTSQLDDLKKLFPGGRLPFMFEATNSDAGAMVGQRFQGSSAPFLDKLKALITVAEDGTVTVREFDAALAVIEKRLAAPAKPTMSGNVGAGKNDTAAAEALRRLQTDYDRFLSGFEELPAEDPFARELQKIEDQRRGAIEKLQDLQAKLKKSLGVKFDPAEAAADRRAIGDYFDDLIDKKTIDNFLEKGRESGKKLADGWAEGLADLDGVVSGIQERVESERLDTIEDSIERERQMRRAEIERWYQAEQAKLEKARQNGIDTLDAQKTLDEAKAKLDEAADERARRSDAERKRLQREQLVGTREWAKKMGEQIGTVPDQVTRLIGESKMALAGFFDDLFSGIASGNADLAASFNGLVKNLGQAWGRMLSDMLAKTIVNGESIATQLRDLRKALNSESPLDRMAAGAAMGSFVGGFFQKPGNQAQTGGAVGGAIGAIWGPAGAAIGSALGSLIGSMIQKGKDSINVAIVDGVATVTEKGISAQARQELETQVLRRVKDEMKAWQSILDLFPDSVKEQLAKLKKTPTLNLTGGIESADLTDEGALNALSDFLGNKLPAAAFGAYSNAIKDSLGYMGVQTKQITALFTYWGTLQGSELQDAVRSYVTTLVEAVELRDLMTGSFDRRLEVARTAAAATPLSRMDEIDAQMASIVASASKLTDIEDVVAAQQRVNDLARQRYDMEIAYLQRIDSIQKTITESIASQAEQIRMAGMDDQGKVDYVWEQMNAIRGQLLTAVDPEEIQRLTQKLQGYVSQAFGLAPDNAENRDKLLGILDEVGAIADDRLESARNEVKAREEKQLSLLEQMVEILSGIRGAVTSPGEGSGRETGGGTTRTPRWPGDEDGLPHPNKPTIDRLRKVGATGEEVAGAINGPALAMSLDELAARRTALMNGVRMAEIRGGTDPAAIAEAVKRGVAEAMSGLEFAADTSIDGGAIDASGLFESLYGRTILRIRDNRDVLRPRT